LARESTEWAQFYWLNTEIDTLPRVLLIGDSIVVGYHEAVADILKGKATVSFYSTSKCVGDPSIYKELEYALGEYKIDLVHFNNGLHGFTTEDREYGKSLEEYAERLHIQAGNAKLAFALSTPITVVGNPGKKDSLKNSRVLERNRLAAEIMSRKGIPVDDLYTLMDDCQKEYSISDGYHYNDEGYFRLGNCVAHFISELLGFSIFNKR